MSGYGYGNPAGAAAAGNMPGMALIATSAVGLMAGIGASLEAAAERRRERAYVNSLNAAIMHADEMEDLARAAVLVVAELEAELMALRSACTQRQAVIDVLKTKGRT